MAQTLIGLGIDLSQLTSRSSLRSGLQVCPCGGEPKAVVRSPGEPSAGSSPPAPPR